MAAKKTSKKVVVEVSTEQSVDTSINKIIKGPHHIVKDGEIILDPNFVNPGVFSHNA